MIRGSNASFNGAVTTASIAMIATVGAAGCWVTTTRLLRRILATRDVCDRVLVSLQYIHFVEQARWAMERRGLRIREGKVSIGPHAIVVMTYRLLFQNGLNGSTVDPRILASGSEIPTSRP